VTLTRRTALGLLLVPGAAIAADEYRAGVAVADITPELPFRLTGFAARTRPAETVSLPIHAKALAIDDGRGGRAVILTADLLGVTREITDEVARRLTASRRLQRREILFNASHTHSGPSVWPRLHVASMESPEVHRQIEAYGRRLIDTFTSLAQQALDRMSPARISYGVAPPGSVTFAKNRRTEHLARVRPGARAPSPVDHSVPVWRITSVDGKSVRAILFGYACHNTVLTAEFSEVSGDYAGYAQRSLEQAYPGSTALFLALCAGDQRPEPRSSRALAEKYGEMLASAVKRAHTEAVRGPIRTGYEEIRLPFQAHTREHYAAEAASSDYFGARRGKAMLAAFDAGSPVVDTPYPVAAVAFGSSAALLALGGEVVVDYALRLKAEYRGTNLAVAGYSNDVMGYIPSVRVMREGGYEAGDSMMYYTQPGWFTEQVEELVVGSARRVLDAVGIQPR
jgi:hypothetical protein